MIKGFLEEKQKITSDEAYEFIEMNHHRKDDFDEGDLTDRVFVYEVYELKEIPIEKIDIEEFDTYDFLVDKYVDMLKDGGTYPPVFLEPEYHGMYSIIDGTHRLQALNRLGRKTVKAYVGIENS